MDEIIKIKCPFDGAVLSVKNQPGIESKNVTCPICKNKYLFTEFKRVQTAPPPPPQPPYPNHNMPGGNGEMTIPWLPDASFTPGRLRVEGSGATYQLKQGRNVIGRKSSKPEADFAIDTGENRSMSRSHLVIDVRRDPVNGIMHCVSLFKEKVNATYVGKVQLLPGDCIVLNNGDVIRLPDATLRFEIPDRDSTIF